jgi:hypothetical protein
MGCGVERSSCSLWSGLNAVVSLSSYERMLSACITTSRNKKEKCFYFSKRKRRTGNGRGERAQVYGLRVHIVGVVYLGYTRVILIFCNWRYFEGIGGLLCIRVTGLRPVLICRFPASSVLVS